MSRLAPMTSLFIVESPAKCSKIQGFLGPGWRVQATMGHIRALDEDLDAVGLDRDFEPRFAFLKDKGKAIAALKAAAAGAKQVYLASDDDREGEAISYSVAVLLGLDPATTPRVVFHEITAAAITSALRAPRRIDMNRVWAQQARAVLDMMVGFTISPLLWKFVAAGTGLSAGRCQTPALRLVADREAEIRDFTSETTWSVRGAWSTGPQAAPFEAVLTDPLEDEESASNYMENIHDDVTGTVTEAATRPWSESAPKPLITSTLQQEASALYGSQPKNTMRIAQRLYEAGHITYMRTDHAVLSEEARLAAQAYVRTTFGEAFVSATATAVSADTAAKPKKKTTKKEQELAATNAQEAHEAIRPTHIETVDLPTDEDWNAVDRKLYKLIWNRTVQSVMAPCRGEERNVKFRADGDPAEFDWLAVWRRTTFQGWRRVGQAIADLDEAGADVDATGTAPAGAWTLGQSLEVGTKLAWRSLEAAPKETKAPGRYTEATLVRELERKGIGRPSTFASLVGTIIDKVYVEKRDTPAREVHVRLLKLEKPGQWPPTAAQVTKKVGAERQKLAPTALGLSALEFCLREFGTLFDYGFTKAMEDRLDKVAEGTEPWKQICRDTWATYKDRYGALKAAKGEATTSARQKVFAGGIKAVQSKKGPLLLVEGATKEDTEFYGWPTGTSFQDITEEKAVAHVAAERQKRAGESLGDYEGKPLRKCSGPFGAYVAWDSVKVPFAAGDTAETVIAKIRAKGEATLHTLGPFEFRKGPYGIYFFKKDIIKGRKFASLPSGLDPKVLTLEAATKIYQTGIQQKAKAKAFGGGAYKKKAADA
jgi:DNA topoisomerase I